MSSRFEQLKARLTEAEGSSPPGWILFVLDGDFNNTRLNNLIWVPRKLHGELCGRRSINCMLRKEVLKKQIAPLKARYMAQMKEFQEHLESGQIEIAIRKAGWIQKQFGTDMQLFFPKEYRKLYRIDYKIHEKEMKKLSTER